MSEWNQYGLQDALSPIIEEFMFFHDYLLAVLLFITGSVVYIIVCLAQKRFLDTYLLEIHFLEVAWTVGPALFLVYIGVHSLSLLYSLDSSFQASLTLKTLGHQWYWSYEYSDFWTMETSEGGVSFDSYIVAEGDLLLEGAGGFRLVETDNRVVLPYLTGVRILVSRADVLHSWAVPSLGVKIDAMPGRLNQTSLLAYRPGLAYGQCSEICGANHRFIPIRLEFVGVEDFLRWAESAA